MAHEFYIIDTNDSNFQAILDLSTNAFNRKPRCSVDETQAVIQLKDGQEETPILDPYSPLTHEQAFQLMQTSEWQEPDPL